MDEPIKTPEEIEAARKAALMQDGATEATTPTEAAPETAPEAPETTPEA